MRLTGNNRTTRHRPILGALERVVGVEIQEGAAFLSALADGMHDPVAANDGRIRRYSVEAWGHLFSDVLV